MELGAGKANRLSAKTDYEKEVALYDRLASMGVLIKEQSYITKADKDSVVILRGNINNIMDPAYYHNSWLTSMMVNESIADEL